MLYVNYFDQMKNNNSPTQMALNLLSYATTLIINNNTMFSLVKLNAEDEKTI
jgi:hypothetical protein